MSSETLHLDSPVLSLSPSPSPTSAVSPSERYEYNLQGNKLDIIEVKKPVFNACVLSWENICYTVNATKSKRDKSGIVPGERKILCNVSGRSAPGNLTGILGPSGAGKTTLLDLLANRAASTAVLSGEINVNGRPRQEHSFRALANYVEQDGALLGSFTVLETLQMAATLSLPSHIPRVTREMRVQDVLEDMGLRNCARTLVGDVFHKGISHGQRKRLNIAMELLSNPSILLLDEPTSGLDSSSAQLVMSHILRLCKEGKNVVCTIHQPSSSVFDMLTNISLLSAGEQIYFGSPDNALAHFFALGHGCSMYTNPAEFMLELVNRDFSDNLGIELIADAWKTSGAKVKLQLDIDNDKIHQLPINTDLLNIWAPSSWNQFCVMMTRHWYNNLRNPGIFWIRLFMYVMLSLMCGTMYWSRNDNAFVTHNQSMVSLLFYLQAFLVFMSVAALPSFIENRAVFHREAMNNSLSVISFTAANLLAAIPGILLISVVSTTAVVLFAGVHSFGSFLLNLFLSLVVAESLMHLIGALVPHYIIGIAAGAGTFGMFMLCEGFMVPRSLIPSYWIWGYYLAFHTYSFESFMYEHFTQVNTPEAHKILEQYGMENVNVKLDMLILVLYAMVLQLLFVLALLVFHTGKRR